MTCSLYRTYSRIIKAHSQLCNNYTSKSYINSSACKTSNLLYLSTNIIEAFHYTKQRDVMYSIVCDLIIELMSLCQYQMYVKGIFMPIISLYPHTAFWGIPSKHFHPHFTDKETGKKKDVFWLKGIALACARGWTGIIIVICCSVNYEYIKVRVKPFIHKVF